MKLKNPPLEGHYKLTTQPAPLQASVPLPLPPSPKVKIILRLGTCNFSIAP